MNRNKHRWLTRLLSALMAMLLMVSLSVPALAEIITVDVADHPVKEDGWYDSMEEVAVYLSLFGELPGNYLTKKEAQKLGWSSSKGNLWDVAKGCSIGGDRFGNYEGLLPEGSYTECDIDFEGGYRGSKRIVFSDEGIYYTDDHYKSFDEILVIWSEDGWDGGDGETYESDQPAGETSLFEDALTIIDYLLDW